MNGHGFLSVSLMQGLELSTFSVEGFKPSCVSCSDTKGLTNDAVERAAQGAARTMPGSIVEAWPQLPIEARRAIDFMARVCLG